MSETVDRRGEVIGLAQGRVRVRLEPAAGCGGCGSRGACASGTAAERVIELPQSGELCPGDTVTVSMPAASLALAAFLGYLLPPLGLVLGAVAASLCFDGDACAALGAVAGFFAGLAPARLISGFSLGEGVVPVPCRPRFPLDPSSGDPS